MNMTDPIGDMLTRIRNGSAARHEKVLVPASHLKVRIAEVMRNEGYIKDFVLHKEEAKQGAITIFLKYDSDRGPAISDIKRVSRPGLRRYVDTESIPRVLNGMGIAILSTSKGVMADREARKQRVGGELICTVW
jgi:small subunit ribosomal protein S8